MQQKVICVCKICGKEFEGYKLSRYCAAGCKKIADRENMRRHYAREKVKREEAKARAAAIAMASLEVMEKPPKPKPEPKPEPKKAVFKPNTEQCERGCTLWKNMSGLGVKGCHCLHDTNVRCEKDKDGKCLSWTDKKVEPFVPPWEQEEKRESKAT